MRNVLVATVVLSLACACADHASQVDASHGRSDASGSAADGGSEAGGGGSDAARADGSSPADSASADAAPSTCPRPLAAADRTRYVVVSHPFAGPGQKSKKVELLALDKDGKLSATGKSFELGGPVPVGHIVFTPDGKIGYAALERGDIGIFAVAAGGDVTVVATAFKPLASADRLVMSDDGQTLWVLSSQGRQHGGGIYRYPIRCDGSLGTGAMVAAGDSPYALHLVGKTEAIVYAKSLLGSSTGQELHRLRVPSASAASIAASSAAFKDDKAIVESSALTSDGRYVLLTDTGFGAGDRVAVVEVGGGGALRAAQVLGSVKDPADVVASPWGDVALVLNGEGDSITVLDYNPTLKAPFTVRGKLKTKASTPLPQVAVVIGRGQLKGRVLVAENVTLHQLQLEGGGVVKEIGVHVFGSGAQAIASALGVQP